jgi:hypothetical protein
MTLAWRLQCQGRGRTALLRRVRRALCASARCAPGAAGQGPRHGTAAGCEAGEKGDGCAHPHAARLRAPPLPAAGRFKMADDFMMDRLNTFNAKARRCAAAPRVSPAPLLFG